MSEVLVLVGGKGHQYNGCSCAERYLRTFDHDNTNYRPFTKLMLSGDHLQKSGIATAKRRAKENKIELNAS